MIYSNGEKQKKMPPKYIAVRVHSLLANKKNQRSLLSQFCGIVLFMNGFDFEVHC